MSLPEGDLGNAPNVVVSLATRVYPARQRDLRECKALGASSRDGRLFDRLLLLRVFVWDREIWKEGLHSGVSG